MQYLLLYTSGETWRNGLHADKTRTIEVVFYSNSKETESNRCICETLKPCYRVDIRAVSEYFCGPSSEEFVQGSGAQQLHNCKLPPGLTIQQRVSPGEPGPADRWCGVAVAGTVMIWAADRPRLTATVSGGTVVARRGRHHLAPPQSASPAGPLNTTWRGSGGYQRDESSDNRTSPVSSNT